MNRVLISIDNGCTGTIAILDKNLTICEFYKTPVKKEQSYTKKKQQISRINHDKLRTLLEPHKDNAIALIERPLVNPRRYKATLSAMRALEATMVILEQLGIAIQFIDSKEWQKAMLPAGTEGSDLKKASKDIGCRLFPQHKELITKHKDADALVMGEYWRRNKL